MRYDTFTAVHQFVSRVQEAGNLRRFYEDGDLMYFSLNSGERIMGYLIERAFSLQNLQQHLAANTRKGRYSLFIFYADMFLPAHGDVYPLEDWMQALVAVQRGTIYGFEVTGKQSFFFPVYFEGEGRYRRVWHGDLIDIGALHGEIVDTDHPYIAGRWRVASFERRDEQEAPHARAAQPAAPNPLQPHYSVLGVAYGDPLITIKKAYRDLARQYHPDVNTSPEAAARMKQINEAYRRVVEDLTK
jgi:hypothetical protein